MDSKTRVPGEAKQPDVLTKPQRAGRDEQTHDPRPNAGELPQGYIDPRLYQMRVAEEAQAAAMNAPQGKVTHNLRGSESEAIASMEAKMARMEQQIQSFVAQNEALMRENRRLTPAIEKAKKLPTMDRAIKEQQERVENGEIPVKVLTEEGWYAHPLLGETFSSSSLDKATVQKAQMIVAAQASVSRAEADAQRERAAKASRDTAERNV